MASASLGLVLTAERVRETKRIESGFGDLRFKVLGLGVRAC